MLVLDKKVLEQGDVTMYTSNILKNTSDQVKGKTNMKRINPETKTFKVFNALYQGERLTAAEARKRFGVANLAAEASRIRQNGYAVYSNSRKAGNGVTVTEYELGRPSREIVALGYKAKAMGITL
jgi:uncharacterized protein YifE (UPF0438 family)